MLAELIYGANRGKDAPELTSQDFIWEVAPPEPTPAERRKQQRQKGRALFETLKAHLTGHT